VLKPLSIAPIPMPAHCRAAPLAHRACTHSRTPSYPQARHRHEGQPARGVPRHRARPGHGLRGAHMQRLDPTRELCSSAALQLCSRLAARALVPHRKTKANALSAQPMPRSPPMRAGGLSRKQAMPTPCHRLHSGGISGRARARAAPWLRAAPDRARLPSQDKARPAPCPRGRGAPRRRQPLTLTLH